MFKNIFALGVCLFLFSSNSFSQDIETNRSEEIETIVVEGDEQLEVLRHNLYRAEEDFFSLFNELSKNEDFHIKCEQENRHSFTRIKTRKCKSAHQDKKEYELAQRALINTDRLRPDIWMQRLPLQGEVYAQQKRMKKKQLSAMAQLIQESPELLEKLNVLNEAKLKYQQAKVAE